MNILTTEDARFIDREVPKQLGISLEILMENAGRGIVDALWGEYDLFSLNNGRSINSFVLFICGTGNNGADGLVAAPFDGARRTSTNCTSRRYKQV